MALHSTVAVERQCQDVVAQFSLHAGETATFVLGGLCSEGHEPKMDLAPQRFLQTTIFWKNWIAKSKYKGRLTIYALGSLNPDRLYR